jgi:hypothetical protein
MRPPTKKVALWILAALLIGVVAFVIVRFRHRTPLVLRGAITVMSSDTRKEVPVSDVEVSVTSAISRGTVKLQDSSALSCRGEYGADTPLL